MQKLKKSLMFLFSMKFALMILCLFVIACIIGSVIPQGEIAAVYENAYPGWSKVILTTGADDTFHSVWFIVLTIVLCINLLGCNLLHFPGILRRMKSNDRKIPAAEPLPELTGSPDRLLKEMGFGKTEQIALDEGSCTYGIRNRIGLWGAWLTHLGIMTIIIGFALGQMFTVKYTVYGVPGQEKQIGDTDCRLRIDDFRILLREDDTVEQYIADLTITNDKTGQTHSGQTSVNHPWDAEGMRMYQNSTGWAADMAVYKGDDLLQTELVCAGEHVDVKGREDLQILFRAFYPDYIQKPDGMPGTASDRMENPGYFYMLYYQGELLGMNVLMSDEKITVSDYTIVFGNPRSYTLISIKHDPFTWLAAIGGGILLAALVIAFYLRTEEIWLIPEGGAYRVVGRSRKGGMMYREKLTEKIRKCNEELK